MLMSFLVLFALLVVSAAIILLSDPTRVDEEEREAVEREWRLGIRH